MNFIEEMRNLRFRFAAGSISGWKPRGWDVDVWRGALAGFGMGLFAVGLAVWGLDRATPDLKTLQSRVAERTNSLGMRFVWIPMDGSKLIYMGAEKARESDYREFLRRSPDDLDPRTYPGIVAKPAEPGERIRLASLSSLPAGNRPVSRVNWVHASRFAEWLTIREQRQGSLAKGEKYRLPLEREWLAVVQREKKTPGGQVRGLADNPIEWCQEEPRQGRPGDRLVLRFDSSRENQISANLQVTGDKGRGFSMGFRLVLERQGRTP
jgi:hypothetical protein